MKAKRIAAGCLLCAAVLLAACDPPGRPKTGPETPRPEAVMSFDALYNENCAGCHGTNGQNGAAVSLANPVYLAIADDATLRAIVADGEKGTMMPGFSTRSGGMLTDAQIDAIVRGMRIRWSRADARGGQSPPPYRATHGGDAAKGEAVYVAACARCHGADAAHPGKDFAILDGTFLTLVNEQTLRTIAIAGRPDIGQPDWRGDMEGRAMTDEEIGNLTAWMMTQRAAAPGQPYASASPAKESEPVSAK